MSITLEEVREYAGEAQEGTKKEKSAHHMESDPRLDIRAYLGHYGVNVVKEKKHNDSILYCLEKCVFDASHGPNESSIGQRENGALFYQCFHDSCFEKKWADARKAISGDKPVYSFMVGNKKKKTHQERKFKFVHAGSIEVKAPQYIIKPFLESDVLAECFGDSGTGKSLLAIDMGLCVATGTDFHGMKVMQGPVLYIAGEGQGGLGRRFMAWSIEQNVDYKKAPFFVSMMPAALCDADQVDHVIQAIEEVVENVGALPLLIVIDTVARNFGPGNEDATADMTKFVAGADAIRSRYNSTVLLIHHTGHADKSRARGSIALKGALDAEYRLQKNIENVIRLEATKMKDAAFPDPMAFKLKGVDLPIVDEYLNTVTSAVLDCIDYVEPPEPGKKCRGKNQKKGMSILRELYDNPQKQVADNGHAPDIAKVRLIDWRNACFNRGIKRQAFSKIKETLTSANMIQVDNPYVSMNLPAVFD